MDSQYKCRSFKHNRCNDRLYIFIIQIILSVSLSFFMPISLSTEKAADILILKSSKAEVYDKVIDQIKQHLSRLCSHQKEDCIHAKIHSFLSGEKETTHKNYDAVITLGLKARQYADDYLIQSNIINAMIPRGFNSFSVSIPEDLKFPAIILDQPAKRSLSLIKLLLPNAERIGLLLNRKNIGMTASLEKPAEELGLKLVPTIIDDESEIGKKLSLTLGNIDVLLALPDITIHNRKNVTSILLSTYRNKIPLIGFSAAYVKAGALAAVYSTPEDIGNQIAEIIVQHSSKQDIPKRVINPKYFSVSINTRVARSLGIQVPKDPDSIEALIKNAEK